MKYMTKKMTWILLTINQIIMVRNYYFKQVFEGKRHGVQPQNGIPKELGYGYLRFEGYGKIPLGR